MPVGYPPERGESHVYLTKVGISEAMVPRNQLLTGNGEKGLFSGGVSGQGLSPSP